MENQFELLPLAAWNSSTIIQAITDQYEFDSSVAVVYFYFDFNDAKKQRHENIIRSLVLQLFVQSKNTSEALYTLYARSQDGQQQPTIEGLVLALQRMLCGSNQTFVILDALDECKEREELLALIGTIINWKLERLHLLATSRRVQDIEETLAPLATGQLCIQSALVDADISINIRERLQTDPKLRKWPEIVRMEIEKSLIDGAHGMFRWVVCQLEALWKCLKLDALRKALKSLPTTLDDTYARILCSIDEECSQDALKILKWLAYSARPLRIEEVAEVIVVDTDGDGRLNYGNRLSEPRDILTICSSLVSTTTSKVMSDDYCYQEIEELKLAHFSVKEYLVSDRIKTGLASQYSIEKSADQYIAQTCLIYLLHFRGPDLLNSHNVHEYPLARYAAKYWTRHAQHAENGTDQIDLLSMRLFLSKEDVYLNWIRLWDPDEPWENPDMTKSLGTVAKPLYYASLTGLVTQTRLLLETGVDVNAQGGLFGNALQAASLIGHESIFKLLLEAGADVNAQGGEFGIALQAASYRGFEVIVQQLLKAGADVNARGGYYSSALLGASIAGNNTIVQQLRKAGADVNAQGSNFGNALQAASLEGNNVLIQQLLEAGADVNAQCGTYGNALQAASNRGLKSTVQQLLDAGADINAQCGRFGNALQVASLREHKAIVQLLLQAGADVNVQGGYYGNALQAAAFRGNGAIVQLLLDAGADVNAQSGDYGSAPRPTSFRGNEAIVGILLDPGGDIDPRGACLGNALRAASGRGHMAVVLQLIKAGADQSL